MLRLNDFPHVSQVNGMSFVWAGFGGGGEEKENEGEGKIRQQQTHDWVNIKSKNLKSEKIMKNMW